MDLLGFLGLLGDSVGASLSAIVDWTTGGFNTLFGDITGVWGVLQDFINWVKGAVGAIVSFLQALWDWLRNGPLARLIDKLVELYQKLAKWLKDAYKIIKQIKKNMDDVWNQYWKPIINLIQDIRKFLLVFRILGFKWAKQLDDYLVKVETKIQATFLAVYKELNTLGNWINFILDPFGLIQPDVWWGTLVRSINDLWNILWGAPLTKLSPTDQAQADKESHYFDNGVWQQRVQLRSQIGLLPDDLEHRDAVRQEWAAMGYTDFLN